MQQVMHSINFARRNDPNQHTFSLWPLHEGWAVIIYQHHAIVAAFRINSLREFRSIQEYYTP
jgi:hypothetical protein